MTDYNTIAILIFTQHTDKDVVYFTSDGQAFLNEMYANDNAATLPDKELIEIYRPGITANEIKRRENEQIAIEREVHNKIFESCFPEMASAIRQNAARK